MKVVNALSSLPPPLLESLVVLGETGFQLRHIDVVRDVECGARTAVNRPPPQGGCVS